MMYHEVNQTAAKTISQIIHPPSEESRQVPLAGLKQVLFLAAIAEQVREVA
jgi:hypothetical protein